MGAIPGSLATLYALLILLPGFITTIVERTISYRREDISVVFVAKALVYSFINYSFFSLTSLQLISWTATDLPDGTQRIFIDQRWISMFVLLGISVALGLLIGLIKNKDWHMKAARKTGITRRTSRSSIWLDIFYEKYSKKDKKQEIPEGYGPYVMVFLKDGRRIYGWPEYFSEEYSDGPVLFITDAVWISVRNRKVEIPYPGILINGSQMDFVQFYMPENEEEKQDEQ